VPRGRFLFRLALRLCTAANDFTRGIHDRMPEVLGRQDHELWLTERASGDLLWPGSTCFCACGPFPIGSIRKTVDHREAKSLLLTNLAPNGKVLGEILSQDFVLTL
jgi:hypothetical protein